MVVNDVYDGVIKHLGISIAFGVVVLAMIYGPISGESMNPARSIDPVLVSFEIQHLWMHILLPILGGVCSILVWKFIK